MLKCLRIGGERDEDLDLLKRAVEGRGMLERGARGEDLGSVGGKGAGVSRRERPAGGGLTVSWRWPWGGGGPGSDSVSGVRSRARSPDPSAGTPHSPPNSVGTPPSVPQPQSGDPTLTPPTTVRRPYTHPLNSVGTPHSAPQQCWDPTLTPQPQCRDPTLTPQPQCWDPTLIPPTSVLGSHTNPQPQGGDPTLISPTSVRESHTHPSTSGRGPHTHPSTSSSYHGPSLKAVIIMYQCFIHRIRHRLGLWRTRQIINFGELEEWMDRKKFYETMFAKREDWQGLERSELLKYFNDCGHFPTQNQIDEYWDLFHRLRFDPDKHCQILKEDILEDLIGARNRCDGRTELFCWPNQGALGKSWKEQCPGRDGKAWN
ncbi:hypothetical protein ACRRTK_009600 [Alexandromys fortis]